MKDNPTKRRQEENENAPEDLPDTESQKQRKDGGHRAISGKEKDVFKGSTVENKERRRGRNNGNTWNVGFASHKNHTTVEAGHS